MVDSQITLNPVWQPLAIGSTTVKHRIMHTASTLLYAENNSISDRHIAYWRERAKGGAALITTEQQVVHRLGKVAFPQDCTAYEKRVIPQYDKLANAVHEYGCKQFVQLFGIGREECGYGLAVELVGRMPDLPREEAEDLMTEAHEVCPYSRATRGNVEVNLVVQ